jgi:hypothetical protein
MDVSLLTVCFNGVSVCKCSSSKDRMKVNNEFVTSWKKVVAAYLKTHPDACLQGLRKTTKVLVRITEI